MKQRVLVGIAGGSGSGKTVASYHLASLFPAHKTTIISQDSYYKDRSDLAPAERAKLNYDHPDALDFYLMRQHLKELLSGREVEVPRYDFTTHTRLQEKETTPSAPIIIIEGLLVLGKKSLRHLMDIKVFIDVPADIRFIRRLTRDIEERGRNIRSIIQQYLETVRPMHEQFVEKTKIYADIIIPKGGNNLAAINLVQEKIQLLLTT